MGPPGICVQRFVFVLGLKAKTGSGCDISHSILTVFFKSPQLNVKPLTPNSSVTATHVLVW